MVSSIPHFLCFRELLSLYDRSLTLFHKKYFQLLVNPFLAYPMGNTGILAMLQIGLTNILYSQIAISISIRGHKGTAALLADQKSGVPCCRTCVACSVPQVASVPAPRPLGDQSRIHILVPQLLPLRHGAAALIHKSFSAVVHQRSRIALGAQEIFYAGMVP